MAGCVAERRGGWQAPDNSATIGFLMKPKTLKRILYFVMAAVFLGFAGFEWAQAGLTSETYVAGGFGALMAIMGATGAG